jgi:hypothetical protein
MQRTFVYLLAISIGFVAGTLTHRAIESAEVASNMVWVAYYFPDVAVDLFDEMHRPTVPIEDPVPADELIVRRAYCESD